MQESFFSVFNLIECHNIEGPQRRPLTVIVSRLLSDHLLPYFRPFRFVSLCVLCGFHHLLYFLAFFFWALHILGPASQDNPWQIAEFRGMAGGPNYTNQLATSRPAQACTVCDCTLLCKPCFLFRLCWWFGDIFAQHEPPCYYVVL